MTPDDSPQPAARQWKKAIPEARDRLQSKILVWIAVPLLCWLSVDILRIAIAGDKATHELMRSAVIASLFFALAAWRLRAATPMAALCGAIICLNVTLSSGNFYLDRFFSNSYQQSSIFHAALTPLILLFVCTFAATKFRKDRKADEIAGHKGRNAAQIMANLGVAGFCGTVFGIGLISVGARFGGFSGSPTLFRIVYSVLRVPLLAALAQATADTVSSEIGRAFGGSTFMITTLKRAEPGTDGAISFAGSVAGISSAALISATGAPALGLPATGCLIAFAAGTLGLFFDSLLGATIERKGWLGNDLVNFFSTAFAAIVATAALRFW